MRYKDKITEHYQEVIEGTYDCIDRLVLNAYYPQLLIPGGFRNWYRDLKGSDKDLDNAALMRMAGRFGRRVKAFCESEKIPLTFFKPGERKHEAAELLIPKEPSFSGIFAVFVSRASSLLWDIKRFANGGMDIRKKKTYSFVNRCEQPGEYDIIWNTKDLPAGIYFCKLKAGGSIAMEKVIKINQ